MATPGGSGEVFHGESVERWKSLRSGPGAEFRNVGTLDSIRGPLLVRNILRVTGRLGRSSVREVEVGVCTGSGIGIVPATMARDN